MVPPDRFAPPPPESDPAGRLTAVYGPVSYLGGGHHSRVYRLLANGGGRVVKVYREGGGMHRVEAASMRRAGLGKWVLGTSELGDLELLLMPYFPGLPVEAAGVERAARPLAGFLRELHARRDGSRVDLRPVAAKLERFAAAELGPGLVSLFAAVREALGGGRLETEARLCHLDLWCANVLMAGDGRVLVVDWARSAYDDPARDLAILKTGTLDQLPPERALALALELAEAEGVAARLPAYVALQTLHDLFWFSQHEPEGLERARAEKVPRALAMLEGG